MTISWGRTHGDYWKGHSYWTVVKDGKVVHREPDSSEESWQRIQQWIKDNAKAS